jgi:hypothetical protein
LIILSFSSSKLVVPRDALGRVQERPNPVRHAEPAQPEHEIYTEQMPGIRIDYTKLHKHLQKICAPRSELGDRKTFVRAAVNFDDLDQARRADMQQEPLTVMDVHS